MRRISGCREQLASIPCKNSYNKDVTMTVCGGCGGYGGFGRDGSAQPPFDLWGVAKASSVSWVAKFKGDKNAEWKLSNGRSRSYKVIKLLLSAGKWVVAGEIIQHPSLPWNFVTHGFLDPSAFPELNPACKKS